MKRLNSSQAVDKKYINNFFLCLFTLIVAINNNDDNKNKIK